MIYSLIPVLGKGELMTLDLDKDDLLSLVRGISPNDNLYDELKEYGYFHPDKGWNWDLDKLFYESQYLLLGLYMTCKKSWK